MVDRSELEEMVASSPYGTTFIVPTVSSRGSFWSFLVHDSVKIIESINAIANKAGRVDDCLEIRCALITSDPASSEAMVVALLFRFETSPPEIYSAFMNPMEQYVKESLQDLAQQDKLVFEFFDDERVASVSCENGFKGKIDELLASLEGIDPFTEDAFDVTVDEFLSSRPDPALLWEQLGDS